MNKMRGEKMKILTENNLETYLSQNKYVFVDFFATWCGPCTMQAKVLEEYENIKPENVEIIKVNVDEFEDLSDKYNIVAVPTLMIFKDGMLVYKHEGYLDLESLRNKIMSM